MIAVDTDIIVRLIVADNEDQVRRALALAARETLYISFTVLIEAEWVLRSRYDYDRLGIVAALRALCSLIDLRFEHDADAHWAIDRYERGGELADYVHVAAARSIGRLASFERKLVRRIGDSAPATVEVPD